jgi:rubrerythrin
MFLIPENNKVNLFKTLVEFAYAEYGSALEMLAAAKRTTNDKLKVGYINHALDEYRHSKLIFKVLDNEIKKNNSYFDKEFRFTPQNVVTKGYVDKTGFLVEKLNLKSFVEFVYSNEFLAKKSFEDLVKRINNKESIKILEKISEEENEHANFSENKLKEIMKEEDRHWGFAKLFYNKRFPNSNLEYAFKKEKLKNKMRLFYYKNLSFLDKIFNPIINFFIVTFGTIVKFIKTKSTVNKNLMNIDDHSIL